MKIFKNILALGVVAMCLFTACVKEKDLFIPDEISVGGKLVKASFHGIITDENGDAVAGALVQIGSQTKTTDDNGVFLMRNVEINNQRAYVKVTKSGYFNGSRLLIVQENSSNFVRIQMLDNNPIGSFQANSGGTIQTTDGAKLVFPAGAIATSGGALYSGAVSVAAKWLNPASDDIYEQMPGDLRGINLSNQEQVLASYGMLAVELYADNGEKLQIADGKEVEISMPVPASVISTAPASIPLWHFDEAEGFWSEEGSARLESSRYVGKVKHFSFWNCDAPFPVVNLRGTLKTSTGEPIAHTGVYITFVASGTRGYGFTNEDGVFEGKVPKNEALRVSITDPCGNIIFSQDIGPYSDDVVLPDLIIDITLLGNYFKNVSGRLLDCNDDPVANGYVRLEGGANWRAIPVEPDGSFEANVLVCQTATDITVTGFDLDNLKQSPPNTFSITDTDIDLGDLRACDDLDVYMIYYLDGVKSVCPLADFYSTGSGSYIFSGYSDSLAITNPGSIYFSGNLTAPTTFIPTVLNVSKSDFSQTFYDVTSPELRVNVTVTQLANNIGEYTVGTFTGDFDYYDQQTMQTENHTLTGSFRLKRIR